MVKKVTARWTEKNWVDGFFLNVGCGCCLLFGEGNFRLQATAMQAWAERGEKKRAEIRRTTGSVGEPQVLLGVSGGTFNCQFPPTLHHT